MGSDLDEYKSRKGPNFSSRELRSRHKFRGTPLTPPHNYSTRSQRYPRQHSEPAYSPPPRNSIRYSPVENRSGERLLRSQQSGFLTSERKKLKSENLAEQLFPELDQEEQEAEEQANEFPEDLFGSSEKSNENGKPNVHLAQPKPKKPELPSKESTKKPINSAYLPLNCNEVLPSRTHLSVPDSTAFPSIALSATLRDVGGLDHHITKVKESIVLPMLYPKFCESYSITTSRGILFHGPPGTGKTLLARALAHECSDNSMPIAFFHYTSADILSKWVGEAESRIQSIFEAARLWQPSLVFFDEIDGLAPARIENDRPSASLVSALLAAIDGFSSLGRVLVVGSTNRLDAIDPALRRPGRFDQELFFPLPNESARISILKINTKLWPNFLPEELYEQLAAQTSGFCGADLALLCSKASKHAFNRLFPNALETPSSNQSSKPIQSSDIIIEPDDFFACLLDVKPSSLPLMGAGVLPVAPPHSILLAPMVEKITNQFKTPENSSLKLSQIFPQITVLEGNYPISRQRVLSSAIHTLDSLKVVFIDIPLIATLDDSTGCKELSRLLNQFPNNQSELFVILDSVAFFAFNIAFVNIVRQALQRSIPDGRRGFLFSCTCVSDLNMVLNGIRGHCLNTDFPYPGSVSSFINSFLDELDFKDVSERQSCVDLFLNAMDGRPIDQIFQFCNMIDTDKVTNFSGLWSQIASLASSFNPLGLNEIDFIEI